jgi:hypothetical protein
VRHRPVCSKAYPTASCGNPEGMSGPIRNVGASWHYGIHRALLRLANHRCGKGMCRPLPVPRPLPRTGRNVQREKSRWCLRGLLFPGQLLYTRRWREGFWSHLRVGCRLIIHSSPRLRRGLTKALGVMTSDILPLALLAAHAVLASVAIVVAARCRAFTHFPVVLQSLVALFVPIIGAIVVLANSREAVASPQKPEKSDFSPSYHGPE